MIYMILEQIILKAVYFSFRKYLLSVFLSIILGTGHTVVKKISMASAIMELKI